MVDWERHEWELAAARGPGIADDVVSTVHRVRRRRRAVWATLTAVVAVAVAVPLAIELGARTVDGTPLTTSSGRPRAEDPAEIYAAVLGRHRTRPVMVIERACAAVPERPSTRCTGTLIPADVQARVRALSGPGVHFVRSARWPAGLREPAVVGFGELVVTGHQARLGTEYMCGPLCGAGELREFRWQAGHWVQTHRSGRWIS